MAEPDLPTFRVTEALSKDVGRGFARLDPEDLKRVGLSVGDLLEIGGERRTVARAMPIHRELRGKGAIQIDGLTRHNARVALDGRVSARKVSGGPAVMLSLRSLREGGGGLSRGDSRYVGQLLEGLPLCVGDTVRAALFGASHQDLLVAATEPASGELKSAGSLPASAEPDEPIGSACPGSALSIWRRSSSCTRLRNRPLSAPWMMRWS